MHDVVEMWGKCDGADVVFNCINPPELWETIVPADMSDGTYVVEIWAASYNGFLIYRTAILYIYDSKCIQLEWVEDDLMVLIIDNQISIQMLEDDIEVRVVVA